MRYEELIRQVEQLAAGGLHRAGAERALAATLTTLGRCLPERLAADLADQLPLGAKRYLSGPPSGRQEALSLTELLEEIAELEGVSSSEALDHARAVIDALRQAVTGHELQRVRAELPEQLEPLFAPPAAAGWPESHRRRAHP
ncbi:MAG TPA: DUF2267 domain-containing protein [Solirubrobacteraceae bacterium]|nr:DUF2267 domain-containing protein [Solirubrobacteraceae bacterium]